MENMDKVLIGPNWVLINGPKITKKPQNFICPSPKVWDFDEKKTSLHWASIVRGLGFRAYHLLVGCATSVVILSHSLH